MHPHSPSLGPSAPSGLTTFDEDASFQSHFPLSFGIPSSELHDSATPMGPPSTSFRDLSQKRQRNSSPITPLKRRRIQPFPSTGSQRTPASNQISYTSTPPTGPRTREQLDRYYEDVKRDARRICAVENQLRILRQNGQDIDAEPQSSPEPSESAPMTTKKAMKLLEKILMDNRIIERLEEERKEVDVKKRGPKRSDKDGVVKNSRNKEQTTRAKLRKEIRNVRKRIGYAWSRLKAAGMVTEPEALPVTTANTAKDIMYPRMSSPIVSKAVREEGHDDSSEMADDSDSEPMLPTAGRTIARSAMSPSVPTVPVQERHSSNNGEVEEEAESTGEIGDADTNANADNGAVEKQAAQENVSFSKVAHAPRRSIYTPDQVDEEDRSGLNGREETLTHAAKEETAPSAQGSADSPSEKTTNPTKPSNEKTQGNMPPQLSSEDPTNSEDDEDTSDDGDTDSEDDTEDESSDVKLKVEGGGDDVEDNEAETNDVKLKAETDDDDSEDDDDSDDSDDDDNEEEKEEDEGSDVEVKVEVEDDDVKLEAVKDSSEETRDDEDTGDGAVEDQKRERQNIVQPDHPEGPTSSRPSTGLFERMNGIQTSGSFEAMMAELRRAAAERERQAALGSQDVDSDSSDSSDDESLPYFSPEPEAKPFIG